MVEYPSQRWRPPNILPTAVWLACVLTRLQTLPPQLMYETSHRGLLPHPIWIISLRSCAPPHMKHLTEVLYPSPVPMKHLTEVLCPSPVPMKHLTEVLCPSPVPMKHLTEVLCPTPYETSHWGLVPHPIWNIPLRSCAPLPYLWSISLRSCAPTYEASHW